MATCNIDFPNNLGAGFNATITENGNKVTIAGTDVVVPFTSIGYHQSQLDLDLMSPNYTYRHSWTRGAAGWNGGEVRGGTPDARHMANEVLVCSRQVAAQGNGDLAAKLRQISVNIRRGHLPR